MGRTRKYKSLYGRQEAYFKTDKGKEALKRHLTSETRRTKQLEWQRKRRGTIVDKQRWFIETYGDIESALAVLDPDQRASIELYYGLTGDEPLTQNEIGKKLGKSGSTISRINKAARNTLESLKKTAPSQK